MCSYTELLYLEKKEFFPELWSPSGGIFTLPVDHNITIIRNKDVQSIDIKTYGNF